jgi:hypothetical protein
VRGRSCGGGGVGRGGGGLLREPVRAPRVERRRRPGIYSPATSCADEQLQHTRDTGQGRTRHGCVRMELRHGKAEASAGPVAEGGGVAERACRSSTPGGVAGRGRPCSRSTRKGAEEQ